MADEQPPLWYPAAVRYAALDTATAAGPGIKPGDREKIHALIKRLDRSTRSDGRCHQSIGDLLHLLDWRKQKLARLRGVARDLGWLEEWPNAPCQLCDTPHLQFRVAWDAVVRDAKRLGWKPPPDARPARAGRRTARDENRPARVDNRPAHNKDSSPHETLMKPPHAADEGFKFDGKAWPRGITAEQLRHPEWVQRFYDVAVTQGYAPATEAGRLNFFACAARTMRRDLNSRVKNPGGLFTALVKNRAWERQHVRWSIDDRDVDLAAEMLKTLRRGGPPPPRATRAEPPPDAGFDAERERQRAAAKKYAATLAAGIGGEP